MELFGVSAFFKNTRKDFKLNLVLVLVFVLKSKAVEWKNPSHEHPASFPVVLGNFECDVTFQACRENST